MGLDYDLLVHMIYVVLKYYFFICLLNLALCKVAQYSTPEVQYLQYLKLLETTLFI